MIDLNACLETSRLTKIVGKDMNKIDIYEKFVHSMKLLEQLDSLLVDKHYVFKGGTSLLLLFNSPSRFSIDIDICMEEIEFENKDTLETIFKNNIKPPFIDVIRDKERNSHGGRNIKAAHYRFIYNPKFITNENYVLLDVTFQNNSINGKRINVDNETVVQVGEPLKVNTIEIDDLFGDKLTAFAPNTIGVKYTAKDQYGRPKCTEIIKQLHDCSFLSKYYSNIERVVSTYRELCAYQIKIDKNATFDMRDCLMDTIKTCELILSNGSTDKTKYIMLMDGVRSFNDYKIGEPLSVVDIQRFALSVDIVASKIFRNLYPSVKNVNKVDYLLRTGIKEKVLRLIANDEEFNDFTLNCFIDIC